jgi:CheY-like chemotaxis protein
MESIASFTPHLLLSDVGMPGRDGYDLIREVRTRNDALKNIPAIALSAFARPEDRQHAMQSGYQVHLSKPVNPEELVASIASILEKNGNGDS